MRNMKKQKEQGWKIVDERPGLDLNQGDIEQLLSVYADEGGRCTGAAYDAVIAAYYAGLAIGYRNAPKAAI